MPLNATATSPTVNVVPPGLANPVTADAPPRDPAPLGPVDTFTAAGAANGGPVAGPASPAFTALESLSLGDSTDGAARETLPQAVSDLAQSQNLGPLRSTDGSMGTRHYCFENGTVSWSTVTNLVTGVVVAPPAVGARAFKDNLGGLVDVQGAAGTLHCDFRNGTVVFSNVTQQVEGVVPLQGYLQAPEGSTPLAAGASGPLVFALQRALNVTGYLPSSGVDGDFGPMTAAALKSFQADQKLTADGLYGPLSANALNELLASTMESPHQYLQLGMSGNAVLLLQRDLKALGYGTGALTGTFGPETQAALRQAQTALGTTADGVFGPLTQSGIDGALLQQRATPA